MARPKGSADGRMPRGGYPPVPGEIGSFLSGFLEGECCFGIARQTRGSGFRPMASLVARADDGELLRSLQARTNIGRITSRPAYRTSHPQAVWTITAKMDCRRLVEVLDEHPLVGRKAAAYGPWRAAVLRWSASKRLTPGDWDAFPEWKRQLEHANSYRPVDAGRVRLPENGWLPYLAGLVTAEGHFCIDQRGSPRLVVRMRDDDAALLHGVCDRSVAGRVYGPYSEQSRTNPATAWQVFSTADALRIVELFNESAPGGRKCLEFHLWRSAVYERAAGQGWNRRRVERARDALMDARKFRG